MYHPWPSLSLTYFETVLPQLHVINDIIILPLIGKFYIVHPR